jgi:hypothetical protein
MRSFALGLMLVVTIAGACGGQKPAPAAAPSPTPVPLSIKIDGGYAWIADSSYRELTIGSLTHGMMGGVAHSMELLAPRGSYVSGDIPPTQTPEGDSWLLDGFDVTIPEYGGAVDANVQMPRSTPLVPGHECDPIGESSPEANNLLFMPALGDLVAGPINEAPALFSSRLQLTRGTVRFLSVTPCWEFRKAAMKPGQGRRQPMVAGVAAIEYSLPQVSPAFRLQLQRRGSNEAPKSIVIRALAGPTGDRIELRLGLPVNLHDPSNSSATPIPTNMPMNDFDRFYNLLATAPNAGDRYLPYKVRPAVPGKTSVSASPGLDCGTLRAMR